MVTTESPPLVVVHISEHRTHVRRSCLERRQVPSQNVLVALVGLVALNGIDFSQASSLDAMELAFPQRLNGPISTALAAIDCSGRAENSIQGRLTEVRDKPQEVGPAGTFVNPARWCMTRWIRMA